MRVIAVPVKHMERAKGRLAEVLTPLERAALTLAMLEDVLDACLDIPGWQTWVISPDEAVLEVAARRRAMPVIEEEPGLVRAVRQVDDMASGADALAIVLGDLPLLTRTALSDALQTLGAVVAAPAASDGGTNVLVRRPPGIIPPRFGADSFRKHREAAGLHDLPFAVARAPELAFDLDVPTDITQLLSANARNRTTAACREMGLPARLSVSPVPQEVT